MSTRLAVVLGICACAFAHNLQATVSGMATTGGFTQGVEENSSQRQLVRLSGHDGLLSGQPKESIVELITIELADDADVVNLILREIELYDGRRTLLVGAPSLLESQLVRMTLYLKGSIEKPVLLEDTGAHWAPRQPQTVRVGHDGSPDETLSAFAFRRPGSFWVLSGMAHSAIVPYGSHAVSISASSLVGGGLGRAFWHWVWAIVVLASLWLTSMLWHSHEVGLEKR